jgi:hypothetical protein
MRAYVIDSEGVVLIPEFGCDGHPPHLDVPVQPTLRDMLCADPGDASPVRRVLAVFERVRDDGVAIYRVREVLDFGAAA